MSEKWQVRVTLPGCEPAWTCKDGWMTTESHADQYDQQYAETVVLNVRKQSPTAVIELVRMPTRSGDDPVSITLTP